MAAETSLPPKAPGFVGRRKQPPPLATVAIHENETFKSMSIATPTGDPSKHFIGTPSAEGILSAFMNFDDTEGSTLDADFELFNSKCQQKDTGDVTDESFSSVSTRFPNSPCSFALEKKTGESDSSKEDVHGDYQEEYEDDFEEDSDGDDGHEHGRCQPQDQLTAAGSGKQSETAPLPSRAKLSPPELTEAFVCDEAAASLPNQEADVKAEQESDSLVESIRFGIKIIEGSASSKDVFAASGAGEPVLSRENFRTFVAYYGGCSPAAQGTEQLSNNLFDKLAVVTSDGSKGVNYDVFRAEFFPSENQASTAGVDDLPDSAAASEKFSPPSRSRSRAKKAPPQLTEDLVCVAAEQADDITREVDLKDSQDLVESIRFGLKVIEESATSCDIFEQFSMPALGSSTPVVPQQKFQTFVAHFGGCSPAALGIDQQANDLFDKLAVVAADGSKGVTYEVFRAEFFRSP